MEIEGINVVMGSDSMTYTVVASNGRTRRFNGETAWSDAQRYANDLLTEVRGSPFGEQFIL